jgi:hypothetical protein
MIVETITARDDLLIRRVVLEPGEATAWHADACHRFTVVVRGDRLRIEFRDGGEPLFVDVRPGLVDWDKPEARVHRGVNAGSLPYEEVVAFFLSPHGIDPQPQRTDALGPATRKKAR